MKPKHQRVHEKRLRRKARQRIKRHQTFVDSHGTSEERRAKNARTKPSLAGPDKRPSIRGSDWVATPKTPVVKEFAAEQGLPVVEQAISSPPTNQ